MLVFIVAFLCVPAALWLWSLMDVLSWPTSTWDAAGLSRPRWIVRVLLLGLIGSVLYVRSPRRELRAAYTAVRWGR